jgi:hypothetical protein
MIFVASNVGTLDHAVHNTNILIAVNELASDSGPQAIRRWLDQGRNVFLDSGIFSLTMEHARKHECSMNEALALAPHEIDGFGELRDRYLSLIIEFGDQCWGYIEMDQGGRQNKIKTRVMLESKGLRPIPVYHPLNDGWDYFDELAKFYDRICLGNIVQADQKTRVRLLTTILKRRQDYPKLWIHGLGLAPVAVAMSLPLDSIDASSWLSPIRWPQWPVSAAMTKCADMPEEFFYRLDSEFDAPDGHHGLRRLLGFDIVAAQRNWRKHVASQEAAA